MDEPAITEDIVAAHGFTPDEYAEVIRILNRDFIGNTLGEPLLANAWPNLFATTAIYHITR